MKKANTKQANAAPAKKAVKKSAAPKAAGSAPSQSEDKSRLEKFFGDELKDIYWAEKHLVKTLPKMRKAASSAELQNAFADHLEVTKGHVARLEQVFELIGKKAQAKKCEAMEGITKEGEDIIEETEAGTATRDVGLVLAGQKVEHYEIATYGGLAQLARTLGYDQAAEILETTLGEEKEADSTLTKVAENNINYQAAGEQGDSDSND
jgi:ferritin-like metal-binding protein YciE